MHIKIIGVGAVGVVGVYEAFLKRRKRRKITRQFKLVRVTENSVYINVLYISARGISPDGHESIAGGFNMVVCSDSPLSKSDMLLELDLFNQGYSVFLQDECNASKFYLGVEKRSLSQKLAKNLIGHKALYRVFNAEGQAFSMIQQTSFLNGDESLQTVGLDYDNITEGEIRELFDMNDIKKYKIEPSMKPGHYHAILPERLDFMAHIERRVVLLDDAMRIEIDRWRHQYGTVFNILYGHKYY